MKQIRALRANGIVSSVITAVCSAGDIYLHSVDVCSVRRSNGRTKHLVDKTGKGEIENEND